MHGLAKLMGTIVEMGYDICGFQKGPQVKFFNWNPENAQKLLDTPLNCILKGPILILLADATYALWLILQVRPSFFLARKIKRYKSL